RKQERGIGDVERDLIGLGGARLALARGRRAASARAQGEADQGGDGSGGVAHDVLSCKPSAATRRRNALDRQGSRADGARGTPGGSSGRLPVWAAAAAGPAE